MNNKVLYLTKNDVQKITNNDYSMIISSIEDSLKIMIYKLADQPDKISQIFDNTFQNRINCMPSTLYDIKTCGMKWVSVFPSNQKIGLNNVEAFTILSEIETGGLKCIMNSTDCTSMRTAAVGAVAAKLLARKESKSIGFIGAGEEAKAHFRFIKYVIPGIKDCYISSRTDHRIDMFVDEMKNDYPEVNFYHCHNNFGEAIKNADIIVTAISSQEQVLKTAWIKKGALYIHVAGLEDEYAVAEKADKIICDNWECVKHRTQTITQMYNKGILHEEDIYGDLGDILIGKKPGRESDNEFIYFNSVGLSVEDVLLSNRIYEKAVEHHIGTWLDK